MDCERCEMTRGSKARAISSEQRLSDFDVEGKLTFEHIYPLSRSSQSGIQWFLRVEGTATYIMVNEGAASQTAPKFSCL